MYQETQATKTEQKQPQISFKERVRNTAVKNAQLFQETFIEYEYCIMSEAFADSYRIVHAHEGNYLHLIGVSTSLPAEAFFKKCLNGTLSENDFDFKKSGVAKGVIKGAVRDKIRVLSNIMSMFSGIPITAQEGYKRNQIDCAFASSDNSCVLGFSESGHPKTLLRDVDLDVTKSMPVDIILKRKAGELLYPSNNRRLF